MRSRRLGKALGLRCTKLESLLVPSRVRKFRIGSVVAWLCLWVVSSLPPGAFKYGKRDVADGAELPLSLRLTTRPCSSSAKLSTVGPPCESVSVLIPCAGFSIGILISTNQVYNSEIVPLKLRGPLLGMFTFSQILGQLISVSIVHGRVAIQTPSAYKLPFALEWIWPALLIIAYVFRFGYDYS